MPNGFRPLAHVREVHRPTRMEQPRSLLELAVDWFANVILPVYAGMHVAVGALKFGGLFEQQVHHQFNHTRHFLGAILCLMASGLLRLGEFFVTKGTAGVS